MAGHTDTQTDTHTDRVKTIPRNPLRGEVIKRQVLKNEKQLGGISMPDIVLKDKGLKINWVQRLYLSSYLSEFLYISTWVTNADI